MSDRDNSSGLGEFLKQVWAGVVFLMGIVSAILGYVKLAQGDLGLFTFILIGVGIAGLFLSCFYHAVIWKPELEDRSSPILIPGSGNFITSQRDENQQRKRIRRLARLGLLLVPILVAGLYWGYQYQANLPAKDFRILVANFETSDKQNHRITQEIFANLERQMEKYEDVEVEKLNKAVDSIKAAKEIGNQKKAAIVIWGDYQVNKDVDTVLITVNFEILQKQDDFPELGESVRGKTQVAQLAELESSKFQTNLSNELTYLSLFTLGMYSYLEEDWSEAVDYFERALEAVEEKQNKFVASLEKNTIYLYLGNSFAFNKSYEKALDFFDKAIETQPDLAGAWNNRGVALGYLGKYQEAIAAYDKAIEIQPDYATAWNNRGVTLGNLGDYQKATADFDKAIKIQPDDATAWYNRGVELGNLGDYQKAIAAFDKAIEIQPDDATAWYNRGVALGNLGKYQEEIAAYDKAIKIQPDYATAWYNRGVALGNLGKHQEAVAAYDKAIEIQPDDATAWYSKAASHARQNQIDLALQNLEQAFRLNSNLREYIKTDADFDGIRSNPDFQDLITSKHPQTK